MKRKKKKTKKVEKPRLKAAQERVRSLKKQIETINRKILQNKIIQDRLTDRSLSLNDYLKTLNMAPQDSRVMRLNGEINELKGKLGKISLPELSHQLEQNKALLREAERELEDENKIVTTEKLIAKKKAELEVIPSKQRRRSDLSGFTKVIRPNWNEITLMDGFIRIYHNGELYEVVIPSSRNYLNKIKSYYSFKNVPLLEIKISNGHIAVTNQELLFFNIKFLSLLGVEFGFVKYKKSQLTSWIKYNKAFYKRELPYLFHTDSLQKLCELCDDNLPIIPVGELVINSKGEHQIHHSFLFPLKYQDSVNVIWESEEESKATYVFNITEPYLESAQLLYEFIAGQTINKRESLIHSKDLQIKLGMQRRLLHKSFDRWSGDLKKIL